MALSRVWSYRCVSVRKKTRPVDKYKIRCFQGYELPSIFVDDANQIDGEFTFDLLPHLMPFSLRVCHGSLLLTKSFIIIA